MKVSAITPVFDDNLYLRECILSIIDYVDELIIVSNSTIPETQHIINKIQNNKIKFIDSETIIEGNSLPLLDDVMTYAISQASNEWILRWDADFIAYDSISELFQLDVEATDGKASDNITSGFVTDGKASDNITSGFVTDGIFLYGLNLYGDLNHYASQKQYKTNGYLMKKECVKYIKSNQYAYEMTFASPKKYMYLNNPDKSQFYYAVMTNCKFTPKILYNSFKVQYWKYVEFNGSISFINYFEKILNKNFDSSVKWVESTLCRDIQKHNFPLPNALSKFISDPLFIIRYDNIIYRDYPHYFNTPSSPTTSPNLRIATRQMSSTSQGSRKSSTDQLYNYEITLVILVRNTEKYLKECLESVFKQTNQRWRIMMINDNSDAGPINLTNFIDQNYMQFIDKIKLINLSEWHGLIKGHKTAMMHVETDIVGILDSDDMLESNAVDTVLHVYNSRSDEIFVYGNFWYCDGAMRKMKPGWSSEVKTTLLNDRCANHFRTFKRKHYFMTAGYDNDLLFGAEDQDILIQLEQFATPVFIPAYLYLYRNTSTSISKMKTLTEYSLYISIIKNIIRRYGYFEPVLKIYSNRPEEIEEYTKCRSYRSLGESKLAINFAKYYFEIHSHDIFICPVVFEGVNKIFLRANLNNNEIPITIKWSNMNYWIINERTFDLDNTINFSSLTLNNLPQIDKHFPASLHMDVSTRYDGFDAMHDDILIHLTTFTLNQYFGGIYCTSEIECAQKANFSYIRMTSYEDIAKHAKQNEYKKILIINGPIKVVSDFKILFNDFIRKIPYDWYVMYLSKCQARDNISFKTNIISDAISHDFSAMGFDSAVFDKLPIIGRIMKLGGKDLVGIGRLKNTGEILTLNEYKKRSYGYIHPLFYMDKAY